MYRICPICHVQESSVKTGAARVRLIEETGSTNLVDRLWAIMGDIYRITVLLCKLRCHLKSYRMLYTGGVTHLGV